MTIPGSLFLCDPQGPQGPQDPQDPQGPVNDNNRRQLVPQSAAPLPLPWPVGPWPLPYLKKCSAGGPLPFQIILLVLSVGLVYAIWSLLGNLVFFGLAWDILATMGHDVANSNSFIMMGIFFLLSLYSVIIRCQEEVYTFLFSYPSFNEYIFNIVAPCILLPGILYICVVNISGIWYRWNRVLPNTNANKT